MVIFSHILIFIVSCVLLAFSGRWLVKALSKISEFFGWKEFTVSFFIMSFATASPELFIGLSSASQGIPELSLGNIIGQNIIHFTLAIAICVFFAGKFSVRSKIIRKTAWFSAFMAFLPIVMILDGTLSRSDGIILIATFLAYTLWIAGRKENYEKKYDDPQTKNLSIWEKISVFSKNFAIFGVGVLVMIIAAGGIVRSASLFAESLGIPLVIIGALIVGLGTALPEVYFSAEAAREKKGELMAGNLRGATVVSTSVVLGIVSIISPISGEMISPYIVSRVFLAIAVIAFLIFSSTGKVITKREAFALFLIYVAFILAETTLSIY